jgi:Glu-tRNA(Gln) amidotransferase subunit E-like FAD-binding protein
MGPFGGLLQLLAKEVGKKGGNIVARDLKQADKAFHWTHTDKIAELKTDVGLSPSYVKELIDNSSIDQLNSITSYLNKENGYSNEVMRNLSKKILKRINDMEDSNAMKEIIKAFREKGLSIINEHFDHFV